MIRVLLMDNEDSVLVGLSMLLDLEGDIEVVGEESDFVGLLDLAHQLKPDLIIFDPVKDIRTGIKTIRAIKKIEPVPVIILHSFHISRDLRSRMLEEGVQAVIEKESSVEKLLSVIRNICIN